MLAPAGFRTILTRTDLLDNIHTLKNPSENDVAAIEPAGYDCGDELREQLATHTLSMVSDIRIASR